MNNSDRRRLGRQLVELADNDCWRACLAILVDRKKQQQKQQQLLEHDNNDNNDNNNNNDNNSNKGLVWLGAVTEHGDGLVHLAAYACCDESLTLCEERYFAYECLTYIIDADFTCVNRIIGNGDGGSPLHCAMAAASSSLTDHDHDHDESQHSSQHSDTDTDTDCSSSDSDSDDEDTTSRMSKDVRKELENQVSLEKDCELRGHSSEEVILLTIQLLLEHNADPNLPLANIHHISNTNHDDRDDDDGDEMELAYSRESIIEQWTPLTFCLSWIALSCTSSSSKTTVALSLLTLNILLIHDANPMYAMGANRKWTAMEFCASCSYHMCQELDIFDILHQFLLILPPTTRIQQRIIMAETTTNNSHHPLFTKRDDHKQTLTIYDTVWNLLILFLPDDIKFQTDQVLSPIQNLAVAILTQDGNKAHQIIINDGNEVYIPKWRNTSIVNILPMSTTLWSSNYSKKSGVHIKTNNADQMIPDTMTLLDMSVSCSTAHDTIIDWIIGPSHPAATWEQLKTAANAMFCNTHNNNNNHNSRYNEILVGASTNPLDQDASYWNQKQIFSKLLQELDRLDTQTTTTTTTTTTTNNNNNKQDEDGYPKSHQSFLDVLLLESCSTKLNWGLPYALPMLLEYGANPKATSMANFVQQNLTPLHFVSSNIRGPDGILMIQYLLSKSSTTCDDTYDVDDNSSYLYEKTTNGDTPIDLSLKKRNFAVSEYLWKIEQQQPQPRSMTNGDEIVWRDVNICFLLGEASIQCKNLKMLQFAIDSMISCAPVVDYDTSSSTTKEEDTLVQKKMGQLLLWMVDERSGLGNNNLKESTTTGGDDYLLLVEAVQIMDKIRTNKTKIGWSIASYARDEISGQTPLHLLLRQDRGLTLREALLPCLCQTLSFDEHEVEDQNNLVSIPSASKFGGYTALHLACSLNCKFSIQTLLDHNAYVDAKDCYGKRPIDYLSKESQLEWPHLLSHTTAESS